VTGHTATTQATLLGGRYPSSHGVRTNGVLMRPGQPLFPRALHDAGYHTAAAGKLHAHPLMAGTKLETYQSAVPVQHYPTTWVTDRTLEMIAATPEPFFVWCGINDPHHPFNPPGRVLGSLPS